MLSKKLTVDIVLPIYNEENELEQNTRKLYHFLEKKTNTLLWKIVIADNASTDKSSTIGKRLRDDFKNIDYVRLELKGRGRAVKYVWNKSGADICVYMDIDLSTDLKHFTRLISSLSHGYDIAIGSRLLEKSSVSKRSMKREILSRGYNLLIKLFFQTNFTDAQCGFKAVNKRVITNLLPSIVDNEWFFDSELLIVAEKSGYKIYEEPVTWSDNPGSTVRVIKTVTGDLFGLVRLLFERPWRTTQ